MTERTFHNPELERVRRCLAGYGGCDVMAEYRNTVSVMGLVVVVGN